MWLFRLLSWIIDRFDDLLNDTYYRKVNCDYNICLQISCKSHKKFNKKHKENKHRKIPPSRSCIRGGGGEGGGGVKRFYIERPSLVTSGACVDVDADCLTISVLKINSNKHCKTTLNQWRCWEILWVSKMV